MSFEAILSVDSNFQTNSKMSVGYSPYDAQNFRSVIKDHVVVMSRRMWNLLNKSKIPHCVNIVVGLTRETQKTELNVIYKNTIDDVITYQRKNVNKKFFIVGCDQFFKIFMEKNLIQKVYLTVYPFRIYSTTNHRIAHLFYTWDKQYGVELKNLQYFVYIKRI